MGRELVEDRGEGLFEGLMGEVLLGALVIFECNLSVILKVGIKF
jgi:hypothetical protein